MNHKIIKARSKEDRGALTCTEMPDGTMRITALVAWNRQHFQQPIRNGATAAIRGDFSTGLRPHETSPAKQQSNTRAILEGNLDRTAVQYHEIRFYDALRSTTNEVLEKISEEYTEKEFREYWAKINEQKSSSPSGRYVGLVQKSKIYVVFARSFCVNFSPDVWWVMDTVGKLVLMASSSLSMDNKWLMLSLSMLCVMLSL